MILTKEKKKKSIFYDRKLKADSLETLGVCVCDSRLCNRHHGRLGLLFLPRAGLGGLVAVFFLSLMQSKHTHKNMSQIYGAKLLSKANCLRRVSHLEEGKQMNLLLIKTPYLSTLAFPFSRMGF